MSTTITSREFHQDSAKVKRAIKKGPVIVTDRGRPSLVVLTYEAYEQLQPKMFVSLADALYMPGAEDIELKLPKRGRHSPREIDW
jgi:prevent-host-death family protein